MGAKTGLYCLPKDSQGAGPSQSASYIVRRLTPLECERLQGLPDGYTDLPGASMSARYKALGNGMAQPCADFIISQIVAQYEEEQGLEQPACDDFSFLTDSDHGLAEREREREREQDSVLCREWAGKPAIQAAQSRSAELPARAADSNAGEITAYALQGNMIGRALTAGPQGAGVNKELCYTLNTVDRHAVCAPK